MKKFFTAIPVLGFAYNRSDLAASIEETTRPIIKHLIKLWLFSDAKECDHWRKEIYGFLNHISKLKGTNKYPSKKFIFNNTLGKNRDYISVSLRIVLTDYSDLYSQKHAMYSTLEAHIESYFDWLATELSASGEVARKDMYSKLKELGFGD